jgi:hypothetical protein
MGYQSMSYSSRVAWCGLNSSGLGHGPVAGFCEQGNEPLGSMKCGGELRD